MKVDVLYLTKKLLKQYFILVFVKPYLEIYEKIVNTDLFDVSYPTLPVGHSTRLQHQSRVDRLVLVHTRGFIRVHACACRMSSNYERFERMDTVLFTKELCRQIKLHMFFFSNFFLRAIICLSPRNSVTCACDPTGQKCLLQCGRSTRSGDGFVCISVSSCTSETQLKFQKRLKEETIFFLHRLFHALGASEVHYERSDSIARRILFELYSVDLHTRTLIAKKLILIRLASVGHGLRVYIFFTCCRVRKRRRMFSAIYYGEWGKNVSISVKYLLKSIFPVAFCLCFFDL